VLPQEGDGVIHLSISFSWWWLLWIGLGVWFLGGLIQVWLICAFSGRRYLTCGDVLMAFLWPLLPVIGFFSVFWE
jgi:hypothetical protein